VPDRRGDAHAAAIVHAYALIEAAQGEDLGDELDVAGAEAEAYGWDDVLALIHYARSFAEIRSPGTGRWPGAPRWRSRRTGNGHPPR
jgi:hypothetical protein